MTRSESVAWATNEFNMIWQNDQEVYRAVISNVRDMLRTVPGMTDQTIGRNVKDLVFAWAYGGGWGYSAGWRGSLAERPDPGPFAYFLDRDRYQYVSEELVGEEARDALGLEGYDRETGDVAVDR